MSFTLFAIWVLYKQAIIERKDDGSHGRIKCPTLTFRLNTYPPLPACARIRAMPAPIQTKKQIKQIADSIERFGFTNPVRLSERFTGLINGGFLVH